MTLRYISQGDEVDKIGIITLNGYFNYGNRLQNYALQETLKSFGYEVETVLVDDRRLDMSTSEVIAKKLNILKEESLSGTFRIISKKLKDRLNQEAIAKRTKLFKDFTNRYISESKYKVTQKGLDEKYERTYSFFVAGSDQIWNPKYVNLPEIYFLTFTEKKKRIAYAASFGISNIPSEFKGRYVEYLNGMSYISLREGDGAKIVEELTGNKVPVLLDPSLLLNKQQWLDISKKPDNIADNMKGKYLLTYFVEGMDKKTEKEIKKTADRLNLPIINMGDINDKEGYISGPSQFIWYINNCSVLCTDSFHGTAFSILLQTPFIVYKRAGANSIYSRIDTLLDKFDLNSRKIENIKEDKDLLKVDFTHTVEILKNERKKAEEYLKVALK